jgi:hypothetical protein
VAAGLVAAVVPAAVAESELAVPHVAELEDLYLEYIVPVAGVFVDSVMLRLWLVPPVGLGPVSSVLVFAEQLQSTVQYCQLD